MNFRTTPAAAAIAVAVLTTAGCAVSRGQETNGACIDGRSRSWFATGKQQSPATCSGVWNLNGRMPHAAPAQEH